MRLVQCEGYRPNGDRCRYHGMADVSSGMFCQHHREQSEWRTYLVPCQCAGCSSNVSYYFTERGVRFYCQWHKRMAPQQYEESETEEEESEEEEPTSEEEGWGYQEEAPAPRQRPRPLVTYGDAYASGSNSGAYGGSGDIQRFAGMQISGAYDSDSDDNGRGGGNGGGRTVYVRNMQVNNHIHYHHHEHREECTIQ